MKKAMVLTVGTGTRPDSDIVSPLKKSITNSQPQRICFLVSSVSEPNARRIIEDLEVPQENATLVRLEDPDDVDRVCEQALEAFHRLRQEGYQPDEIDADFTSGTKAMSAGLALAAAAIECRHLKYISGRRETGVVVPGTEQFRIIAPVQLLAWRKLEMAREFLRHLHYGAASQVIESLPHSALSTHHRCLAKSIGALARAYDAWDKFAHDKFIGEYKQAAADLPELAPFRVSDGTGQRVVAMGKAEQEQRLTEDLLADLYNNAVRRGKEGKYDDQVARLYRLVEMVAQYELAEHYGIRNTSDVRLDDLQVTTEVRQWLEAKRDPINKKIRLGLRDSYALLRQLGAPLGTSFEQDTQLDSALQHRNQSILAHGVRPVRQERAQRLTEAVQALAVQVIPKFEQRAHELQFPWLK